MSAEGKILQTADNLGIPSSSPVKRLLGAVWRKKIWEAVSRNMVPEFCEPQSFSPEGQDQEAETPLASSSAISFQ